MRIALATTQVPFVRGGAELLADSLQRELIARGHDVETVRVPFNWYPSGKLQDAIQANSLLDLDQLGGCPIDLMIGLKFPAYLARHPNKVFWLVHQHRQAYERWDLGDSDLLPQKNGKTVRAEIMNADRAAFRGRPVFTISKTVSERLQNYLAVGSVPLYHPPPIADLLHPGESGDFVLVPSRLGPDKRQDLILRALAECSQPVRAVFVGKPDSDAFGQELKSLAASLKLEKRVQWRQGLSGEELAQLYGNALAVAFTPVDEDYGYVTLEAMLAAKPLVTVTDAGGPLEFISDGEQGLVSTPDCAALAANLSRLWSDRALARQLGLNALARYQQLGIGWDTVINHLLHPAETASPVETAPPGIPAAASAPAPEPEPPANRTPEEQSLARRAGIASLPDLLGSFDFGVHMRAEVTSYLQGHWARFVETALMLPNIANPRVLDLGSARPHIFLGLLQLIYRDASFSAVAETHYNSFVTERYAALRGSKDLAVETTSFNVETATFPYPDNSFDLVLAMEIIEHLALNPAHMFNEIARVLRPGGALILTTPNIASDVALKKLVLGHSPYSFGVFIPYHGVYGRHNREYTPHEIEALGLSSGLAVHTLTTKDVYPEQVGDAHEFAQQIAEIRNPPTLRGQNIFYRGVKSCDISPSAVPVSMYLEDPRHFQGTLSIAPAGQDSETLILTCSNEGEREWSDRTVSLILCLYADDGSVVRSIRLPIPLFVPAGESRSIPLPIAPPAAQPCGMMMIKLERIGRGDLNNVGVRNIRAVVRADAIQRLAQIFQVSEL